MTSSRFVLAPLAILLAAGCAVPAGNDATDEETGSAEEAVRINEQNTHNSLEPQSLFLSPIAANPDALDRMVGGGLQQTLASTYMRLQLHAPTGFRAMKYMVGCALSPGQSVTTYDAITNAPLTFSGEVGLCPSWLDKTPSKDCLEVVSACVLARVNMMGVRVPISLHGGDVGGDGSYVPETVLKNKAAVASFNACATPSYGPQRNCGWRPVGAGQCYPGEPVTVGAGANVAQCGSPLGTSNGQDTMLRVCTDIYGCDTTSPSTEAYYDRRQASSDDACGTLNPSVTFACPPSGTYSVMVGTYDSTLTFAPGLAVGSNPQSFPVAEPDVFRYVEGAFYGNIFDSTKLSRYYQTWVDETGHLQTLYVSGQVMPTLYAGGFACYSARISDGYANLQQRLCTLGSCLMPIAGACRQQAPGQLGLPYRCANTNVGSSGGGQYDGCMGTDGVVYTHPITTFLHDSCDTVTPIGGAQPSSCQPALPFRDL